MDILFERLEAFFDTFESEEAFDLEAQKQSLFEAYGMVEEKLRKRDSLDEALNNAIEENACFRRVLADDCKSRLVLMGERDADLHAEEISTLEPDDLAQRRDEILKRFDDRFMVVLDKSVHNDGSRALSENKGMPVKDLNQYHV
ncbi:hypothetical protein ACFL6I_09365 [candidate division KSB1 bacterium]